MKTKGVIFFVSVIVLALSIPAEAVDWELYGSARVRTWYYGHKNQDPEPAFSSRTIWGLQGNSRIGATVKSGDVGGRFEYGGTSEVKLRRLCGTWDFGNGELLVGQEYTPLDFTISSQVVLQDLGLNGWGTTFSRKPMLQVTMFGFDIALVNPSTSDLEGRYINDPNGAEKAADTNARFPSLETKYTYSASQLTLKAIAGFSTYEIADDMNNKDDVHRWIAGVAARYDMGPAYIAAQFQYGQNLGTWRIAADWEGEPEIGFLPASSADPLVVNGDVKDNYGYGYAFECGYVPNNRIKFAAGLGGVSYKVDMSGTTDDTAIVVFFNSHIMLSSNTMVVPEAGYFDAQEDGFGDPQHQTVYVGAKWQINF